MKSFNKFLGAFSVVFALYMMFVAGISANKHQYADMVLNLLFAVFWTGVAVFMALDWISSRERARIAKADELLDLMTSIINKSRRNNDVAHAKKLSDTLMNISHEVTGGKRAPRGVEIQQIQDQFFQETGHYAKITPEGEKGVSVEISDDPAVSEPVKPQRKSGENMDGVKPPSKKK